MPGRAPKPVATRRRRNRVSTARELAPVASATVPELPAERDWHALTARWWADVWASPMAGEYLDADVHGLFRLVGRWFDSIPAHLKVLQIKDLRGRLHGYVPRVEASTRLRLEA